MYREEMEVLEMGVGVVGVGVGVVGVGVVEVEPWRVHIVDNKLCVQELQILTVVSYGCVQVAVIHKDNSVKHILLPLHLPMDPTRLR